MSDQIELVVPNVAEFNLRHPALQLDPGAAKIFGESVSTYVDSSVFWTAGRRVIVLPAGVDRLWLSDVHSALGVAVPSVLSPEHQSGQLLSDLLRDGQALAALRGEVGDHALVRLVVWGATPDVYRLAALIRGWGPAVELEGTGEDSYWASLYLDSKQSCLDMAGQLPGVRVPRTITVTCHEELTGAVRSILARQRPAIVKGMFGVGGHGATVIRPGSRGLDAFWTAAHRDPLLRTYPLHVQEFLDRDTNQGCPAVDLFLDETGARDLVVSCMTVDGHRFRSVDVGSGSLRPEQGARVREIGWQMGTAAHALGFRGSFCVDFLTTTTGELYVTEINARRSGAAAAITLLDRLGRGDDEVAHCDYAVAVGSTAPVPYADIRSVFQKLWKQGVRAYPASICGLDRLRPSLGIITIAATVTEARRIADRTGAALGDGRT